MKNYRQSTTALLSIFFGIFALTGNAFADVTAKNATSGSKLVSKLSSPKGDQQYDLPAGVKWQDYKSLVIHCEKYTKLWGGSDLK